MRYSHIEDALSNFSENFRTSDLLKDLRNFNFMCTVGYMDVDKVIDEAEIVDLCAEVVEGTRFDSFDLNSRRTIPSDWKVREERRKMTPGDRPFMDQLGQLSDGEGVIKIGVLYGSDGYGISVIGTENIRSEASPLLKFCEAADLTI